jgi:molecular chaperone DnaJ
MPDLSEFEKKSYYELLGVEPSATLAEIKEAYREIARVYHPDSNYFDDLVDSSLSDSDNQLFRLVTAAYNTLVKESERKAYDEKLQRSSFTSDSSSRDDPQKPKHQPKKQRQRSQFGVVDEQSDARPRGTPYCKFGQQAKFQADAAAEEAALIARARRIRVNLALFGATVILVSIALSLCYLIFK